LGDLFYIAGVEVNCLNTETHLSSTQLAMIEKWLLKYICIKWRLCYSLIPSISSMTPISYQKRIYSSFYNLIVLENQFIQCRLTTIYLADKP